MAVRRTIPHRIPRRTPRLIRAFVGVVIIFYALIALGLFALRAVNPPTTAVQMERRLDATIHHRPYQKTYEWAPLGRISPSLQHAVVSAEDARFYQHHGFDWHQVRIAVRDDLDGGRSRGASTITQQLARNLFLSTGRSWLRKGIEFTIVPMVELILGKRRILELYLNVIEWGPGIYGAEAAAQHYFHTPAQRLTREQAIGLASVLPAPLRRKPGRMTEYDRIIADRMAQAGW